MAFGDSIVKFVNDTLKAGSLKNKKFQPGSFHGISTIIARKNVSGQMEVIPGIADMNGEYKTIEPNDKFSMVIYHKPISNSYQYVKQDSYGEKMLTKSTSEFSLVVWADSKKIKLTPEQLEATILAGMPQLMNKALLSELNLRSGIITPVSSDMDKLRVFRQEYPNTVFFLRPYHILFQLRYRAELTFDQHCLVTCGCGPQ